MASAIGIALISTILEPMTAKAMEKLKAMVEDMAAMVGNNVDGIVNIRTDISNLQKNLRMIKSIVRVAEEKQIDDDLIRNWLRDLVDIAYKARDVLDNFITFSSCVITGTAEEALNPVNFISSFMPSYFGGSSSDTSNIPLAILNRLAKDIRSVRESFDEKKEEGRDFMTFISVVGGGGSESVKNRRPEVGPEDNKQGDGLFLGREDVKKGIMDKILEPKYDRVDVVVIWGMGGIGKTTLAQSIYNDERVKKVPRSWSCVGVNKFSAEKVIKEILNDQNTIGIGNLQTKLKEKLKGDRFLIVLDDVWDVDGSEWDLLFNPLTKVENGGMIIITRREKELCPALINIQTPYNLPPLSEEDSWSIFESCAYVDGKADSTSELKPIGEKIVKKLNGHPLALKVVGRSLWNKDSSTWKKFLESKFTKDDEVMSALRWSYNHLPPHLKTCFTYCALFPKDHALNKKELVEMWMAHDLIEKEEQERPEDVGARYFEQLVNASLLQRVDENTLNDQRKYDFIHAKHVMHDLIHDLALLVSNGEFANSSLTNDKMETVRHVYDNHKRGEYYSRGEYSKVPRLCKMEKLLTLYTIDDRTDDEIYPTKKYVLDVFNKLKSIRVLVLHSRKITDIPDCISELRHLRYLDVSRTGLKCLPDSLCHLYNLQMLAALTHSSLAYKSFSYEYFVKLPRDIVNISSLRYVRASLSTCKGVGKLTSLQELSCIDVCEGDNIRELGDMQILRGKLTIRGLGSVEKLEDGVGALMDKQTLMDELVLEFDKQLEKSTISEEVLDALGCPPNLTYLRIAFYNGLKLPSWMVSKRKRKREYKHPIMNAANFMTSLSRLEIHNCNGLKRLQLDALVSLKELDIRNCSRLVQITPAICESFKILNLVDCESLRSLSIDIHGLDSLERLHIRECPKLELSFKDGSSSSSSSGNSVAVPVHEIYTDNTQVFRTLLHHELVSLESLEIMNLGGFENFDETETNNFYKSRSLKYLCIWQCEDLKSLPADFHKLSSLKTLVIRDCSQLQSLPHTNVAHLQIISCPLLYERCKDESGLDWHKINHIPERRIRLDW